VCGDQSSRLTTDDDAMDDDDSEAASDSVEAVGFSLRFRYIINISDSLLLSYSVL